MSDKGDQESETECPWHNNQNRGIQLGLNTTQSYIGTSVVGKTKPKD